MTWWARLAAVSLFAAAVAFTATLAYMLHAVGRVARNLGGLAP